MSHGFERYRVAPGGRGVSLDDYDPDDTSLFPDGKKAAAPVMETTRQRLADLQELLFAERKHALLVILQGMDTSGKDGTVRHVMGGFNPAGVRVIAFKRPSDTELAHDYLWRVHATVPERGDVAVFNRSHYEDVLVVRVHDLVPHDVWHRRYDQINDFERMLSENGTIVVKFFLHISKDEQRQRLQKRIDDPTKRWKFQHGDIGERKLWHDYRKSYEEALTKTSTEWAPWWIVPADAKWYRNYVVGEVLAKTLGDLDMKYPRPDLSSEIIE